MLKHFLLITISSFGLVSVSAVNAADPIIPIFPIISDVDDGLLGNFYLRGSVAANAHWAREVYKPQVGSASISEFGRGYSYGVGVGYETGTGPRFDVTWDHIYNENTKATLRGSQDSMTLEADLFLANAYYDFGLGSLGLSAAGGMSAYVGAGVGVAMVNSTGYYDLNGSTVNVGPSLDTVFATAAMTGVSYDWGNIVTDLGYRLIYMPKFSNDGGDQPADAFEIKDSFTQELRATVRYRF